MRQVGDILLQSLWWRCSSFVMPILVESPANIQNIFPVARAQSANSGGQDSIPVEEEEEGCPRWRAGDCPGGKAKRGRGTGYREQQEDLEDQEEQQIVDSDPQSTFWGCIQYGGSGGCVL